MSKVIDAVFQEGVFRPLEPVSFPEGSRITITLLEVDENEFTVSSPSSQTALESDAKENNSDKRDRNECIADSDTSPEVSLEEVHDIL